MNIICIYCCYDYRMSIRPYAKLHHILYECIDFFLYVDPWWIVSIPSILLKLAINVIFKPAILKCMLQVARMTAKKMTAKTVLNFEFDVQNFKDLNQCIPYMDYSFSSSLACTTKVKQKNPVSIITIMNFSYVYTKYYFFHLMGIYCRALASSHFPSINWKNSKKTAKVFFANQNYST